jgi:hypothetical protein
MGRVYSQATRVVVWLGLANDYSKVALKAIRWLATALLSGKTINDDEITSVFKEHKEPKLDIVLREEFNGRSYWSRLWIMQEILLGTKEISLCFGHDSISWDVLHIAFDRLRQYLETLPPEPTYKEYLSIPDLSVAVEEGGAAGLDLIRNPTMFPKAQPAAGSLRRLLGMAQRQECQELSDKVFGLLGMTDFDMPVEYNKQPFEIYSESMHYFQKALLPYPEEDPAIYTVKLSQVFQSLLKGPFPHGLVSRTVPCVKMTGILSGAIIQIDEGSDREAVTDGSRSNPNAKVSKDVEEEEEEVTMRLRNILIEVEESSGHKIPTPHKRLVNELVVGLPMRNLVWACIPHYFKATRKSVLSESETKPLNDAARAGAVPIAKEEHRLDYCEAKLFVASPFERESASSTVREVIVDLLIGFATPDAQNGDLLVRFLESEFCLVVRNRGLEEYSFVGCAIIPQLGDRSTDYSVHDRALKIDHLTIRGSAPSYDQFQDALKHAQGIDIMIDLEALQFITNVLY